MDLLIQILIAAGISFLFRESMLLYSAPADKKSLFIAGRWIQAAFVFLFFLAGTWLAGNISNLSGDFSVHLAAGLMALLAAKTIIQRWKKQIAYHVYYVESFKSAVLLSIAISVNALLAGTAYGLHSKKIDEILFTLGFFLLAILLGWKKTGTEKSARTSGIIGGLLLLAGAIGFLFA